MAKDKFKILVKIMKNKLAALESLNPLLMPSHEALRRDEQIAVLKENLRDAEQIDSKEMI